MLLHIYLPHPFGSWGPGSKPPELGEVKPQGPARALIELGAKVVSQEADKLKALFSLVKHFP